MAQEHFATAAGSFTAEVTRRAMFAQYARTAANSPGIIAGGLLSTADLQITAPASGMSVNISTGEAIIGGTSGGAQGGYYLRNTAQQNVSVAAANATNPRVDAVVGTIADAGYAPPSDVGGTTNGGVLAVVTGTPTAGATLANLSGAPAIPTSSLLLGYVLVPATSTNVTAGNIVNLAAIVQPQTKGLLYRYQQAVSNYATTSTSLVAVDSTNMNPPLALGGTIRVSLTTSLDISGTPFGGGFDLLLDGNFVNDRLYITTPSASTISGTWAWTIQPTAGVHTIGVAYANNQTGTFTLHATSLQRVTFTVERIG